MAKKKPKVATDSAGTPTDDEWLLFRFDPVSLFSLRMTHATNKGGKTLVVPTPYAFKMALIDACFRSFASDEADAKARRVFSIVKGATVRFQPPTECVVQNTFVKIRQDERDGESGFYTSTIAYREWVYYRGVLTVALSSGGMPKEDRELLQNAAAHVAHLGKRGCFWQHLGCIEHAGPIGPAFTIPQGAAAILQPQVYGVSQFLDDFGEALCKARDGFERISTYHDKKISLGEHRVLVPTLIPYVRIRATRNFTRYQRQE